MAAKREVVVVTGSSGCLGQHVVKLLQEKDDSVGEIRLLDRVPYVNHLGHAEGKAMRRFVGDIRDVNFVMDVLEGADCVIHAACNIDVRLYPDVEAMESTNIEGTQNVIDACLRRGVARLVFASSTNVVSGSEHIFYGIESTTPLPTYFMIGKYAEIKCRSEQLVLKASGALLENGRGALRTVAVRSTPFYGEQDRTFFYNALRYAKRNRGYYLKIRSLDERLQICYVGNAAWAHLKAKEKLAVDESISGEAFFITDETPVIDVHEHVIPYLKARGFRVSNYVFPYWLAWLLITVVCFFIHLSRIVAKFNPDILPTTQLNFMCTTFFFNRSKATLRLDYQPIYSVEEAQERSMGYYSKVELK